MKKLFRKVVLSAVLTGGTSVMAAGHTTELPGGGNRDLPMLSVIGLGILGGGVVSALRTRQQRR